MSKLLAIVTTTGLSSAGEGAGYSTTQNIYQLVGTLVSAVFGFLGVIFLVLMIYAGFIWMTSAGNSKLVDKAKSILISATVGVVICLSAFGISTFILGALSGSSNGVGQSDCFDASCGL
jgi:hypothetical protein